MKKAILVTGTPGTGKTVWAKKFSEDKGFVYVDVTSLIKDNGLSAGYDAEKDCAVVDDKKLEKTLIDMIKKSKKVLVIDSHMVVLPPKYVEKCYVVKCEL